MSNYTLFPDADKRQTDDTAITALTSTVIDGGTGFALGIAVPAGPLTAHLQLGGRAEVHGSQVIQSRDLFGAFHAADVTLTSVADDGNGFADYTLVGHLLSVGDVINVTGSTAGGVDGVQKVTSVPDANSIVTDQPYVASATAGVYNIVAGTFATMTEEAYIMRGFAQSAAGGQYTYTGFGNDFGIRRSIHKLEFMRTNRVATAIRAGFWDIFAGVFTTAPTVANDEPTMGQDDAANPTYAIPGELVYRVSGQQDGATFGIIQDNYEAKTG